MKEAFERLVSTCKTLSDEQQSRVKLRAAHVLKQAAIAITNCHLHKSGKTTFPCSVEQSIRECTQHLPESVWNTYTLFYVQAGRAAH